jgi:hypothetical protein
MEVDGNILLVVGDPQGILDHQLRPHPIHLLNITINFNNFIKLDNLKGAKAPVIPFKIKITILDKFYISLFLHLSLSLSLSPSDW